MSFLNRSPEPLATQARNATAAGLTYHIAGELVPVLSVDLGLGQSVFFEHHILLWKDPSMQFGIRPLSGMIRRMIAGMDLLITEAMGPGQIAFSRDAVGQIFPVVLSPGQELHVREHQFLAASSNVDFTWDRISGIANMLFGGTGFFIDRFRAPSSEGVVWLHGNGNVFEKTLAPGEQLDVEPGGWLYKEPSVGLETFYQGLTTGLLGGAQLACNRFTGPGRIGLQSMSVMPLGTPVEQQAQAQTTAAAGAAIGIVDALTSSLFGNRR
jgi:uncharacterized protein (AIM24 family)